MSDSQGRQGELAQEVGRLRTRIRQLEQVLRRQDREDPHQYARPHTPYANCPLPYQALDKDGYILEINPAGLQVLGHERHEVVGHWFGDFLAGDDRALFQERFLAFKTAGKMEDGQFELVCRDGTHLTVEFNGGVEFDPQGRFLEMHCIFQDVTERKRLAHGLCENEVALRESQARYKALFENMQNGFALHEMVFDEEGKPIDYIFLDVNTAFEKQTAIKGENLIGRRVTEVLPGIENDPADWMGVYGRIVLTGDSISFESYAEPLKKWYSVVAYRPSEGQFAAVFIDITDRKLAQANLQCEMDKSHTLLDNLPCAAMILKKGSREIVASNKAAREIGAIPGKTCYQTSAQRDDPCPFCLAPDMWATGEPVRMEVEYRGVHYEGIWVPLTEELYVHYIFDITERKRAEETLKTYQYYLEKAQEMGHIGTWELDIEKNILKWTDENYRIFGVPLGTELSYENFLSCIYPEDRDYVHEQWTAAMNHKPYDIEHRLVVNGKVTWVREKADMAFDEHGNAVKAIGFTQDITDRKLAQEELDRIFDLTPDMIAVASTDGYFKKMNVAWERVLGYDISELLRIPFVELIHPEDRAATLSEIQRQISGQATHEFENRYRCKDGSYRWLAWVATPVQEGNLLYAAARDVTDVKLARQSLEEQHTIFNHLVEQTLAGYWDWRIQENTEYMSPTFKKMFGYEDHELANVPETWQSLIFPQDLPGVFEVFDRHVDSHGEEPFYNEARYRHKDGSTVWVICTGQVIEWGENDEPIRMIGCHVDITKRKRAQAKLRDSEKRSLAWLEHSPVCTKIVDLDFNLQFMSASGAKSLRIDDVTELYGKPYPFEFYPESFRTRMTGNLTRVKETGEIVTQEASVVDIEGNESWFHSTLVPVDDEEGRIEYILVVSIDTTERRRAEQQVIDNQAQLKSLASELVLAEERERNRIAVHLHDDICQNLAYSKMKLQMTHAALDDPIHLDDMTEVSDTLTRMMQDVRTLTFELSSPVLTEFGLEAAVSQWLTEQIEQKHGIATTFTDDGQAKPLKEDIRALLFRSVRELLANVVKHSKAKRVEVNIFRAEDQVVISFQDDGIGFSPDKVVVGTSTGGFGLFSVRERLSQLGGSLDIDSEPGQGCKSVLRAPLQQSNLEERPLS